MPGWVGGRWVDGLVGGRAGEWVGVAEWQYKMQYSPLPFGLNVRSDRCVRDGDNNWNTCKLITHVVHVPTLSWNAFVLHGNS